jgi:general secretion pathway protein G
MMRIAIDNYTLDKEWPPQSLQNLVDAQYLPAIPTDPFTESKDWVCEVGEMDLGSEFRPRGLYDVHSRSNKLAADGSRYDRW